MKRRPIISGTIRAKDNEARDNLQHMLTDLALLLGNIGVTMHADERQLILGAMCECDLESVCRILRAGRFSVEIDDLRVIYLETIRKDATAEGKYIR